MGKAADQNKKPPEEEGPASTADLPGVRLETGSRIGHFRIEQEIGRGGMGIVYLACDITLDRPVAIKSLPPEVMADPRVKSRLRREARLLAALNHPNVAAIYDQIEEAQGIGFLVLEYVPGQTLADRLVTGPMPVPEALSTFTQIADGLEAAHQAGIVHRDLKPANIKITEEGRVKILDFGVARAIASEGSEKQSTITEAGRMIGTPAYMSPEQTRGRPVDKRADIWAFGCCLYESLTGRCAFAADTASETLARILEGEPEWSVLPPGTPAGIRVLLRRCLEKDPQNRLHDIADARIEISESQSRSSEAVGTLPPAATGRASPRRTVRSFLVIVTAIIAGGVLGSLVFRGPSPPVREPWSFPLLLSPEPLVYRYVREVALSPNGRQLVYVAADANSTGLYVRASRGAIRGLDGRRLPGTEGAGQPFFSPDSRWLGFRAHGQLKKVSLDTGEVRLLCDVPTEFWGASWGNGTIIFAYNEILHRISAAGGGPVALTKLGDDERSHRWPDILPDGRAVLFTVYPKSSQSFYDAEIAVCDLQTGERKTVIKGGTQPCYVRTGHVVYGRAGTLYAVPFDPKHLVPNGRSVPIHEGVWMNERYGSVQYAISREEGTLAYLSVPPGGYQARRRLTWVDRRGNAEAVPQLPRRTYAVPRVSPDRRYVVAQILEQGNLDIWVYDLQTGVGTRITNDPGTDWWPMWTPDSQRVVFSSYRNGSFGLYWRSRDGSQIERLTTSDTPQRADTWSTDGKTLVYCEAGDIWLLEDVHGKRTSRLLLPSPGPPAEQTSGRVERKWPAISPDGRWMAYVSDETGEEEVYVRPFPDAQGGRWLVSKNRGNEPLWAPDGRVLFYRDRDFRLMRVPIAAEPEFVAGEPEFMFRWPSVLEVGRDYDISPDGERFLFVEELESDMIIVQDWLEELKGMAGR